MSKKKNKERTNYEIYKATRRDWGELKPITKVIPNKKKNRKEKYPNKEEE